MNAAQLRKQIANATSNNEQILYSFKRDHDQKQLLNAIQRIKMYIEEGHADNIATISLVFYPNIQKGMVLGVICTDHNDNEVDTFLNKEIANMHPLFLNSIKGLSYVHEDDMFLVCVDTYRTDITRITIAINNSGF